MNTNFFGLRELALQKESINKSIESYLCTHFYKWFMANYPQLPVFSVTDTIDENCVISVRFDYDMKMRLSEMVNWKIGDGEYRVIITTSKTLLVGFMLNGYNILPQKLNEFLCQNKAVAKYLE